MILFLKYYKSIILSILFGLLAGVITFVISDFIVGIPVFLFITGLIIFLTFGILYATNRHDLMKLKNIPTIQTERQEYNIATPSEWWGYVLYDIYEREKLTDMISSYINDCFHNAFPYTHIVYENLYMIRDMFYDKNEFIKYLNNTFADMQKAIHIH